MTIEQQPPDLPVSLSPKWPPPKTVIEHIWRTLALAGPSMAARVGILVMFTADTLMVGRAGGNELVHLGLGLTVQMVLMMIAIGFMQGGMILTAQNFGSQRYRRCGAVLKVGLAVGAVLGVFFAIVSFITEPILWVTGQDPQLISGAASVAFHFAWGMPGMLLYIACSYFMEGITRPIFAMLAMIFGNVLNIALNVVFVFGWGEFVDPQGASGAVIATSITRWFVFAFMAGAIWFATDRQKYGLSFGYGARSPSYFLGLTGRMLRISYPMGIGQGLDAAAFSSLVLMAGLIGAAATSAHQITQNVVSLAMMVAIGMSAATAVRVGNAIGRRDPDNVKLAGWTGVGLGIAILAPVAAAFTLVPAGFASLFTSDGSVTAIATDTIWVAGIILVFNGALWVTLGALRGTGDTFAAMVIQVLPLWIVAVPLGAYLAFSLQFGAVGLYYGLFVGILISLIAVFWRFRQITRRLAF